MSEEKKRQYVGILSLGNATPMTLAEAKEAGLIKYDREGEEEDGYKATNVNGHVSWLPKTVFEEIYTPLSDADAKFIDKLKEPLVDEIKKVLKLRGHVDQISKKKWSLKRLGSEVLKVYEVSLDDLNNDSVDY